MARLAWRNLWRNRRRSLIAIASLGCGLAAIMFGQSMIKTIQIQLIAKATGVISGHIQVVDERVEEARFPEHYIDSTQGVERALSAVAGISAFEKRILVTGLVSSEANSVAVLLIGVEPGRDTRITTMHTYISEGRNLGGGRETVLGAILAEKLKIGVGDTLVVMAQSADGSMSAENFKLTGILRTGSHTWDANVVYLALGAMQEMLGAGDRANNFVLRLQYPERLQEVRGAVLQALKDMPVKTLDWQEVNEELVGVQRYQNAIMTIMLVIIFLIVSLGILNTLLMSMFERVREFGVLMAIGARPGWILRLVLTESCILGFLGATTGVCLGAVLILHFQRVGLNIPLGDTIGYFIPFDTRLFLRFQWSSHRLALAAVWITCILSALPPALRAARLKPAEAIRRL